MSTRARLARAGAFALASLAALAACHPSHPQAAATPPAAAQALAETVAAPSRTVLPHCEEVDQAPGAGAPDDRAESLMHEAFPGWSDKHGCVLDVPGADDKDSTVEATIARPAAVMAFDEDHRVLVVAGEPSDDDGQATAGHSEPGNLGAYAFSRRDGRWFRTDASPSIDWTGFMGDPGHVQVVEFGPGHPGLIVTNGSCWQGSCGSWAEWLELDASAQRLQSGAIAMTDSSNSGATEECQARLEPAMAAASAPSPAADGNSRDGASAPQATAPVVPDEDACFAITGTLRIVPVDGLEWSDIVVEFRGAETVRDLHTRAHVARRVHETATWRHRGETYELIDGRVPTHGF